MGLDRDEEFVEVLLRDNSSRPILGITKSGAARLIRNDPSELQHARVCVTHARILTLQATPFVLVPAPGIQKMLEFVRMSMFIDTLAGAYTNPDDYQWVARYGNAAGPICSALVTEQAPILGGAGRTYLQVAPKAHSAAPIALTQAQVENQPLVLHDAYGGAGTGELLGGAAGNRVIVITQYRVWPTEWRAFVGGVQGA